jgi:small subunit ribosomal protein S4
MARYTGPKVRISRRLNTNIFENEKGSKALDRRPFPPGAHGRTRRRNAGSEYLAQLQEKQKAKYIYGVLERQFRNTYEEANRLAGPTGENLLRLLELRLDNIVFRAGWGSTRPQARQFVNHGLILVDGKRVDIASFRVKRGHVISLSPKAKEMIQIQHNIDTLDRALVGWLEAGDKQVTVRDLPQREVIESLSRGEHHACYSASFRRGNRRRSSNTSAFCCRPTRARLRPHHW